MSASEALPHAVTGTRIPYRRSMLQSALAAPYLNLAFTTPPNKFGDVRDEIGRCAANLYFLQATLQLITIDTPDNKRRTWLVNECIAGEKLLWEEVDRRSARRGRWHARQR